MAINENVKDDKDEIEWQVKIRKHIAETDKALSDIHKNGTDMEKNRIVTILTSKKVFWYEISLLFIFFGLGIAFTKLFIN